MSKNITFKQYCLLRGVIGDLNVYSNKVREELLDIFAAILDSTRPETEENKGE